MNSQLRHLQPFSLFPNKSGQNKTIFGPNQRLKTDLQRCFQNSRNWYSVEIKEFFFPAKMQECVEIYLLLHFRLRIIQENSKCYELFKLDSSVSIHWIYFYTKKEANSSLCNLFMSICIRVKSTPLILYINRTLRLEEAQTPDTTVQVT